MKLELRQHETVIHPQPFVEDEPNPLVITTQRIIYTGTGKRQEIEGGKIKAKAKGLNQRILAACGLLLLLGLPFFIIGLVKYVGYRNEPTSKPADWKKSSPGRTRNAGPATRPTSSSGLASGSSAPRAAREPIS